MITRLSKGELSPLMEGSPDLESYFEGGSVIENFQILRQGGIRRWPGTRFINEVKNTTQDTILLPFEFSVDDAYILEVGHLYIRIYKTKAPVLNAGVHVEVTTGFDVGDIRSIHLTQSNDVVFLFHEQYQQQKISRVSDTSWSLTVQTASPPPSFEADTDISAGTTTLTPSATTGLAVTFTASAAVFLLADVGRQIIFGASRAVIVTFSTTAIVLADILDPFPNTSPIAAGSWFLRLSPQATLDPNIKEPVGSQVTLLAGANAFRAADVGKYIVIYGGVVKVTAFDSVTQVRGTIQSVMGDATVADPPSTRSWTLEVVSWSGSRGYTRTGEFYQGRLYQASTASQKTTFWGSQSDNFDNYAIGITAADAVEYTMASRQLNRIEWIAEHNKALLIGTSGAEYKATGSGNDNSIIGGDTVPIIEKLASNGCAAIQPIQSRRSTLYIDRSRLKIIMMGFDLDSDGETDKELSVGAEHITESGVRLGPLSFERRPNPRLLFNREDGQMVAMTFFPEQKVVAFSRRTTQGTFESRAVIPGAAGKPDQVWCIVKRTVNGSDRRYVEMFEEEHETLTRLWKSLQTDSAVVWTGLTGTVVSGLDHLAGLAVTVVKNSSDLGDFAVSNVGNITLIDALVSTDIVEIGLRYNSTATTMRPAIPGQVIDGLPRSWDSLYVRVQNTIGGRINGERLRYPPTTLDNNVPYTGNVKATGTGWDDDGRVTLEQTDAYPMTALCLFGTLSLGDHD